MGLLYILLSVFCSLCIAHLLKVVERRKLAIVPVLVVNYLTAAIISLVVSDSPIAFAQLSPTTYFFAVIIGCLFIINFILYSNSLVHNGVGVSVTSMRLSLVIPVLFSLFFFGDFLKTSNYWGIVFVFIALLLLVPHSKHKKGQSVSSLLIIIFFLNGIVDVLLKVYERIFADELSIEIFLFLIFVTAFFVGILYMLFKKKTINNYQTIIYGLFIGFVNLYSSFFLLLALENLSGALVFSTVNILNVFLSTLLGVFYWKDRLQRNQLWGLAFAILAIFMLIV
jgi:drug/metabolite transporter (DMT)-like permease